MSLPDTEQAVPQNGPSGLVPAIGKRKARYNLPLIAQREYMTRIQQRSFQIVTIILMLIVIVGVSFPTILAAITSKVETQMTIINTAGPIGTMDDQALLASLNTNLNAGYNNSQDPTADSTTDQKAHFALHLAPESEFTALRQKVRANQLSILLQISRNTSKDLVFTYYTNEALTQNADLSLVQAAATQLRIQEQIHALGISDAQASSLFSPPDFTATSSLQEQSGRSPAESNAVIVEVLFAIVLLFIFIQQYCSMVATGVAEEKGSRIMEILINATTPFQLLLGKVIGIGLVGISQMGLVCIVASAALLAQSPLKVALGITASNSFSLPGFTSISFEMLGLLVLFFVLGFLLYATLYAAAGALVSRQGANGIDGLVSCALGASAVASREEPTVLVIGDLSFFHDLNGLLAATLHRLNLTIVLINNDGGGIFSFLPQAAYPENFEQLFGTPTGLDFHHIGQMYGTQFQRVTTWEQFRTCVHCGIRTGGLHIVEVPTERTSNVSMHRQLWQIVNQELLNQGISVP